MSKRRRRIHCRMSKRRYGQRLVNEIRQKETVETNDAAGGNTCSNVQRVFNFLREKEKKIDRKRQERQTMPRGEIVMYREFFIFLERKKNSLHIREQEKTLCTLERKKKLSVH